jgi:hypothetical protein
MDRSRRGTRRGRIVIGSLTLLACGAASVLAIASDGDDRGAAESALRDVEASPRKDMAGEPITRAHAALERATRMRTAGDEAHARIADGVARKWAEVARDIARAAVVEESAATARRGATDAGAVVERERALLEEAIAQSGRLRAQLDSVDRGGKEEPARTSAAANSDAGARAPTAAPPAGKRPGARTMDGGLR